MVLFSAGAPPPGGLEGQAGPETFLPPPSGGLMSVFGPLLVPFEFSLCWTGRGGVIIAVPVLFWYHSGTAGLILLKL